MNRAARVSPVLEPPPSAGAPFSVLGPTQVIEAAPPRPAPPRTEREPLVRYALLALTAVFFLLRFLHLAADFPNGSRWMDWSKYTDEGWYGDAAIRHYILGHWYVPGDFNAAAALPVWPALEAVVFRFTGVGIVPARVLALVVFGATLVSLYALVRRYAAPMTAAVAVFLVATSSFSFAFSRLAILEPPLILLFVLALLVASYAGPRRPWTWLLLGLLAPLIVLTKTTGATLLPAVAALFCWSLWRGVRMPQTLSGFTQTPTVAPAASQRAAARVAQGAYSGGFSRRALVMALAGCLVAAATAAGAWSVYYLRIVKPHYYADYHYLFTDANPTPAFSLHNLVNMTHSALGCAMWIDRVLYPLALAVFALSLFWMRELWRNPLYASTWVAVAGYMGFVIYHSNMQPRYFHVMLVPVVLIAALGLEAAWRRDRSLGRTVAAVCVVAVVLNVYETAGFLRRPQYTFLNAADNVARIINADKNHSRLLLSISGSDISLITGVPSICDDFGVQDLESKAVQQKPGWYAAWNELDEGTMSDITPHFRLKEVARFSAFDDPDRNTLILYRMTPRTKRAPRRSRAESAN